MTPKDKLISELSVFLHEAFHAGFNAENVSELHNFDGFVEAEEAVNNYAIGRWVSVEERLPHVGFKGQVKHQTFGIVLLICEPCYNQFGTVYGGEFVSSGCVPIEITHWLELEMPGGAE